MAELTHIDEKGRARMVDVSGKKIILREAVAKGKILMKAKTARMITEKKMAKGNVLEVARLAAIMGAKRTSELIPLCHPLSIDNIEIDLVHGKDRIEIEATVRARERTGLEMEALTAVGIAALTIYDMCKAVDKEMVISDIRLVKKTKKGI